MSFMYCPLKWGGEPLALEFYKRQHAVKLTARNNYHVSELQCWEILLVKLSMSSGITETLAASLSTAKLVGSENWDKHRFVTLWGKTISWHVLVPYDRKIRQSKCDVTTFLFVNIFWYLPKYSWLSLCKNPMKLHKNV